MLCSICKHSPATVKNRCRSCYNEYMRQYMLNRYYRRRAQYVEEWGGRCVDCGSKDNLEFDHVTASSKEVHVGPLFGSASDKRIRRELVKCVLRCSDCHKKKSIEVGDTRTVAHGGGVSGKKNCGCTPCKTRKAAYMRTYRTN